MRRAAVLTGLLLAGAAGAPAAQAAPVTLWGCHGPAAQPLGATAFTPETAGDGSAAAACDAPGSSLDAGGLQATLGRPDPAAGSAARWQVAVPDGLAVSEVRLLRRTTGFGGTPVPGGAQRYVAETSSGVLESSSVEDDTDVGRDGQAALPTTGGGVVRFGVACGATASGRCAAPTADPLAVLVGSVALRADDASAPRGAVGGISSPAAGTLDLRVRATDEGVGLARAEARVDGARVTSADLGGPGCADLSPADPQVDLPLGTSCAAGVEGVALRVPTQNYADGVHALRVTVTDAAGNETVLADEPVTFRNAPIGGQSSATVGIGTLQQASAASGSAASSGARPGSGTSASAAGDEPPCASPRLTMFLRQRPLRVLRGVPQLVRGRRYRFGGTLSCVVDGRRRTAPAGVGVAVYNRIGGRTYRKGGLTTRAGGGLSIILSYRSSRVLEFRRTSGRTTSRVRIRLAVVRPPVSKRVR